MKTRAFLAGLCVALIPQYAGALQLTNRDATDHTLIVADLNDGETRELTATPSQVIDGICMKGCTITMSDGQEYEFDGNEIVSIEDGLIFMDGPYDTLDQSGILDDGPEAGSDTAN